MLAMALKGRKIMQRNTTPTMPGRHYARGSVLLSRRRPCRPGGVSGLGLGNSTKYSTSEY